MPAIFVSHTSADDALVRSLTAWLDGQGFNDHFVDHEKIRGGDSWREALRAAKASCRVVICVVTPRWLASEECMGEFLASWYQGKRIVPLLLIGAEALDEKQRRRLDRVLGEDQGFDLSSLLHEGGLDFAIEHPFMEPLRAGLRAGGAQAKLGLDPRAFEIDAELRPDPFPGLESFGDNDADAAIFFGRSGEIAQCLETLREMRAQGDTRPLIVLGASGSGKSSLVKAGVLPRLRREPSWIGVRAFKPGSAPLFSFAEALARTLQEFGDDVSAQEIWSGALATANAGAVHEDPDPRAGFLAADGLVALGAWSQQWFSRLRRRAGKAGAQLVITIDQAEELVTARGREADILLDLVRALGAVEHAVTIIFTVRSDAFHDVQKSPRFHSLQSAAFDVRPTPIHRYGEIIEGPANRYGVTVEPALVEALLEDAPKNEALPLLAFALQRLWARRSDNHIALNAYKAFGQLSGLIEDGAESALRGAAPGEESFAGVRSDSEKLARRAFVPHLAQINEQGAVVRRVAPLTDFDADTRAVLDRFVAWRLLVIDHGGEDSGATIEVTHEALFRHWPRLQLWLEPERAALDALRDVENAARLWRRHDNAPVYLQHRGALLDTARKLSRRAGYEGRFGQTAIDYLNACRRLASRRLIGAGAAGAAAFVMALSIVGAQDAFSARQRATAYTEIAEIGASEKRTLALAGLAPRASVFWARDPMADDAALQSGLGAAIAADLTQELLPPRADGLVSTADIQASVGRGGPDQKWIVSYGYDGARLKFFNLETLTASSFPEWSAFEAERRIHPYRTDFSDDGRFILIGATPASVLLNLETGAIREINALSAEFSPGSRYLVWVEADRLQRLDLATSETLALDEAISTVRQFSPNGADLVVNLNAGGARVVELATGASRPIVLSGIHHFSADGSTILTDSPAGMMAWRRGQPRPLQLLAPRPRLSDSEVNTLAFALGYDRASTLESVTQNDAGLARNVVLSSRQPIALAHDLSGEAVVWNLGTRRELNRFSGILRYVASQDGTRALLRTRSSAFIVDVDQGSVIHTVDEAPVGIALSNDGRFAVFRGADESGQVFDTRTRRTISLGGAGDVARYRFSPDNVHLLVISRAGQGRMFNLDTGAVREIASAPVVGFEFSKDGAWLVLQNVEGEGLGLNIERHELIELGDLGPLDYEEPEFRFSGNGDYLYAKQDDGEGLRTFRVTAEAIEEVAPLPTTVIQEIGGGRFLLEPASMRAPVLWDLSRPVVARDARFGPQICSLSQQAIASFPVDVRSNSETALGGHLRGRPWHPCDWRGLASIEGWRQLFRMQAIRWFGAPDYTCGEVNAAGRRSGERLALCEPEPEPTDEHPRFNGDRVTL